MGLPKTIRLLKHAQGQVVKDLRRGAEIINEHFTTSFTLQVNVQVTELKSVVNNKTRNVKIDELTILENTRNLDTNRAAKLDEICNEKWGTCSMRFLPKP